MIKRIIPNYPSIGLIALLIISCFCCNRAQHQRDEKERSPSGSRVYIDTVTGMEFIFVKGSTFRMGDVHRIGRSNEHPHHEVTLKDFYMGKHEVTRAQFQKFINETGYITMAEKIGWSWDWNDNQMYDLFKVKGVSWKSPGFSQGENHPVVFVSWNDASAYAEWLSQKSGLPFRLPTETEWEYAAKGGTEYEVWAGTSNIKKLVDYAWFGENSLGTTHPVGKKNPNSFGFYDMSGNVWEWCQNYYHPYKKVPPSPPPGEDKGRYRTLRGGGWKDGEDYTRTTYRNGYSPDYYYKSIGFRLAFSPEGQ